MSTTDPDPRTSDIVQQTVDDSRSIGRAISAGNGEVFKISADGGSITIGRALPKPFDDEPDAEDNYPATGKTESEYDTWLG